MSYQARAARASDVEWLYTLRRATYLESVTRQFGDWDEDRQRRLFEESLNIAGIQILVVDGQAIGMVSFEERDDCLWLVDIQIEPAHQGAGIGSAVIRDLMSRARVRGCPVRLRVLHENPRAKALYDRLGFRHLDTTETHHLLELAEQADAD